MRLPTGSRCSTPSSVDGGRRVYLHERGGAECVPVFDGESVGSGLVFAGPCLIETPTFTALLKNGHRARTDDYGNFQVEVE